MWQIMRVAGGAIACAAVWACTPTPIATTFPVSNEQKLQAAHHWAVLADEVAAAIAKSSPPDRPIYVAPLLPRTEFGQAFESYLATDLLARGVPLARDPAGAVVLDYGVERVTHFSPRQTWPGVPIEVGIVLVDLVSGGIVHQTNSEVIVTAALSIEGRQILRETRAYAINDADTWQYPDAPLIARPIGPRPELPPRAVRVVSVAP